MTWSLLDRELTTSFGELAELMDSLWGSRARGLFGGRPATASAGGDVWVSDEDALVTFELPGVKREDVHVSVEGDTVTVKGERRLAEPGDGETYHRRERGYGKFERSVEVPFRVDSDKVEAKYENGVLHVRLPRAPEYRPRQIEVKVG